MTVTSDDPADTHRAPISDDAPPSQATYRAVAEMKGHDPLELPPLARTIDTDSLDALVGPSTSGKHVSISFEYAGCLVTVTPEEVRVATR